MSSFFDSELVREEMDEISRMQEGIYSRVFEFPYMDKDSKIDHVNKLQELLDKQSILYTRLSLSDDPEAKEMKENIIRAASALGFSEGVDMNFMFSNMTKVLDKMRRSILDTP